MLFDQLLCRRLTDGVCLISIYCMVLSVCCCRGTLDGGLDIPHSDKRFAGFKKNEKWLDTEIHRNYIYEDHVADCMKSIADEEPEEYQFHFSEYIKKGIAADDMEALYKKVHATIRDDPTMAK
ncbi:unnamed protein product [Triticum turgidum subsp. durum]|uniref:Ribosomal protein L5 eukaryotic C-terminal domain-containing protein n=1 Tax=Triticum turgidum subsp. durum TaxID=4567 RepID=A0A9R0U3Y5_TRITD|nr:unnamed protein product [Triticum turgidum subsp. durum]